MGSMKQRSTRQWKPVHQDPSASPSPLRQPVLAVVCCVFQLFLPTFTAAQSELSSLDVFSGGESVFYENLPSVYGASKYEQKVTEAPSSVSIITADEIKKYGYRTLADILRSLRGFYVSNDRNVTYLGVRGFGRPGDYNIRTLLLVDGHRFNDNVYDAAEIGTDFPVDVDLIDRVEVIRGPSSSLYGANAFFGVINVITKRGRDLKGFELSGSFGSFDTYKSRVTYGNKFQNGLEVLLSGTFYDSDGDERLFFEAFNDPATNNGVAKNADDDRTYEMFAKLGYKGLTLLGGHARRKKILPTASFETVFNTDRTFTIDERTFLDLKYAQTFAKNWHVTARLSYNRYYYAGHYFYDYAEEGDAEPYLVLNRDFALGEWWGGEMQLTKRLWQKHKFTGGVEFRHNLHQNQWDYDAEVGSVDFYKYIDDKRDSVIWAVFAQGEFSLLDNLILNVGARYDHYDSFGSTFNPRAALIYNPFKTTSLKFLYGEAFRAPNSYELFYNDRSVIKANPNLEPETIRTYELVLEQTLTRHLRGFVSAYYYTIDDLITLQTDPADDFLVFRNTEKLGAKGVEFALEGKWDNVTSRISYAWQDATNQKTGAGLSNSPHHMAKFNVIAPLLQERIFASLETQYMSSRKTLAGRHTGESFVTNLTLFSNALFSGLELSASIYNLFDDGFGDPGSLEHAQDVIRQDGRAFRIKVQYSF